MLTSTKIVGSRCGVVNVASVPQRSPFRYPGGKTWLVPYVRELLQNFDRRPRVLVEPFAGGAIVGLTVAAERLADEVLLCEIDADVAAVWHTMLGGEAEWLANRILSFEISRRTVVDVLSRHPRTLRERAFQTLLRNRVQRGGILAPGASLVRKGENGRGVASRWYPETLARRIETIAAMRDRIRFVQGDGMELAATFVERKSVAFFVDPPYTAGGKRAGHRLYLHNHIDHSRLFKMMSRALGYVMLTYDDSFEVRSLARAHRFDIREIPMKSTHHAVVNELVITNARAVGHDRVELREDLRGYTQSGIVSSGLFE